MLDFQCSQGVFRKPLRYGGDERADQRLLSAGIRPYVETNLLDAVTMRDVTRSNKFYSTFHASSQPPYSKPYPFPEEMFLRLVKEYGGIPPIVIAALPDGQAHYVGEPHVQVFCDEPGMGELVGWIESSMLPYLWTSSVVATRGRIRKDAYIDVYRKVYRDKSDEELAAMCAYKFHDFGRRGGASTLITGIAHLINWLGTDTCDAAFLAQMDYNAEEPFGASSIMAAAHRTVTTWPTEDDSIRNAIERFGDGFLAFVADSYNYLDGMWKLASYAQVIKVKGGFLVGRPDSGDVVETVIQGMRIFDEQGFGINEKATAEAGGLRVLNLCGILQGDGVSDTILFSKLFPAVISAGYSPINLAIGMGEYNHRAVRSDTEEGYKTCLIGAGDLLYGSRLYEQGYAQVMKGSENLWKRSIPCPVGVRCDRKKDRVYPISVKDLIDGNSGNLQIVFDGRPGVKNRTPNWELFSETRGRAWGSWRELTPVPGCDTFDPRIRRMQEAYMAQMGASLAKN
jgi:nicotinic acid phosphoribosyltransferase